MLTGRVALRPGVGLAQKHVASVALPELRDQDGHSVGERFELALPAGTVGAALVLALPPLIAAVGKRRS